MLDPNHWSIPERYMVRYHLSHLVWWGLGVVGLLIVVLAAALALTSAGIAGNVTPGAAWWYLVLVVTPLLTLASLFLKPYLLNRIMPDWSLYRAVTAYTRTYVLVMVICFLAGALPCALVLLTGKFGYPLLIVIVPLAAMLFDFPHTEKFSIFVEDILEEGEEGRDG